MKSCWHGILRPSLYASLGIFVDCKRDSAMSGVIQFESVDGWSCGCHFVVVGRLQGERLTVKSERLEELGQRRVFSALKFALTMELVLMTG